MGKWILKLLVGTIASFYYFPFVFSFFPALITKNAVAVLGLVFVLILLIQKREFTFTKELLILLILSSFVSIVALFSITYNQTPDVTYVSYIRSACIWLSGAFAVSYLIYLVHGKINLQLVINYLIGVCIFQCTAALLIEFVPAVASIVGSAVIQGQGLLKDMGRLYGVGASLDVAGSRFSAVLVGTAFAIERNKDSDSEDFADLTLVFDNADGTTDKVSAVEFTRNAESDIFYNPYGQRVKSNAKGIVISNGVKRFNK